MTLIANAERREMLLDSLSLDDKRAKIPVLLPPSRCHTASGYWTVTNCSTRVCHRVTAKLIFSSTVVTFGASFRSAFLFCISSEKRIFYSSPAYFIRK